HHAFHRAARPHDFVAPDAAPKLAVFFFEPNEPEGVLYREEQLVGRNRFFEEVDGAELRCADGHVDRGLARDHHDRRRDSHIAKVLEHRQTVLTWHDDI